MSERRNELARAWIRKARNDLFTAGKTLESPEAPTDTPCFHAQQAVEKSLKAVFTSRGIVHARTHDLLALLDEVFKSLQISRSIGRRLE